MQGWNSENIQTHNRALVLGCIRCRPYISRIELAEACKLRQTTISNIVNELIELKMVEETGTMAGSSGRKPIGLQVCRESCFIPSVLIEAGRVHGALFDLAGNELWQLDEKWAETGELTDSIVGFVSAALQKYPERPFLGLGVAVASGARCREDSLGDFLWMREVSGALGARLPLPIRLLPGAGAAAFYYGCEEQSPRDRSLIYLHMGTSITCGVVRSGVLLPGEAGFAGELGHTSISFTGPICDCGARGCLNLYASLLAVKADMEQKRALFPQSPVRPDSSMRSIATHYNKGDELTVHTVDTAGQFLGVSLGGLIQMLHPYRVVIGGELSTCGNGYLSSVRQVLVRQTPPDILGNVQVVLEKPGCDSALLGVFSAVAQNSYLGVRDTTDSTGTAER